MGPFDYSVSRFGMKDTANTDVFWYAGDLMTLWYNAGDPYRLDAMTLHTRDHFRLTRQGTDAHVGALQSRLENGELLFFDYADEPPYMTYGVADAGGRLLHEVAIDLPGPRLPHDIGFTTPVCDRSRPAVFPRYGRAAQTQVSGTDVSSRYAHALRHHSATRAK